MYKDKIELWLRTIVYFAEKAVPVILMITGALCILSQIIIYLR